MYINIQICNDDFIALCVSGFTPAQRRQEQRETPETDGSKQITIILLLCVLHHRTGFELQHVRSLQKFKALEVEFVSQ